jgi:hypothetical protein
MNQIVRAFKAWQYRGGRPQRWARIENRLWAIVFAAGLYIGPIIYGNEDQTSALRASRPRSRWLTSRPCEPGGGGERPLRHAPGTFG